MFYAIGNPLGPFRHISGIKMTEISQLFSDCVLRFIYMFIFNDLVQLFTGDSLGFLLCYFQGPNFIDSNIYKRMCVDV